MSKTVTSIRRCKKILHLWIGVCIIEEKVVYDNYRRDFMDTAEITVSTNPFAPKDAQQIFSDLAEARQQIAAGEGMDMKKALDEMGKKYGFF